MLAIARPRGPQTQAYEAKLLARLGSSLCAGIGGAAATASLDGFCFAYRQLHPRTDEFRCGRPAVLPGGRICVFHGYFDNAAEVAAELATGAHDLSRLYGLAVERWGNEADRHVIGDYCSVMADPESSTLRLSRSPLRAPPLYYFHDDDLTVAASVPRALFATGIERRLNEARIADMAMRNQSDEEASPYANVFQVPRGSIVTLAPGRPRRVHQWYDLLDIPFVDPGSDEAAIARVGQLLDEAVDACLRGFRKPGATLSAGLDSPQVAVRAQAALPPGRRLATFTFHPEAGYDGRAPRWKMGDERPFVEAFLKMHPGLEPHFTANEGYEHDYRCRDLFHLTGDPTGIPGTYVFHGLLSGAAREKCDVLLLAEFGNATFSDTGACGFVEYLLTGRWRQLWLALTRPPIHAGSFLRRLASRSLSALLPNWAWVMARRILLRRELLSEKAQPLSREYRTASGADDRLKRAGTIADRHQPRNRRHARRLLLGNGDPAAFHQGMEQMYGVALRDPTTYRPFVEYCLGLPTRMFMRDGELRWLARQMAKGIMPEDQRLNALAGWWDADWHLRIGRRRGEFLAELERIEKDDRLGRMFDVPRLRAALEQWPDATEADPQKFCGPQFAVPMALVTARFIDYVEGRNLG